MQEAAIDALLRTRLDPVPTAWPEGTARAAAVVCPLVAHGGEDHVLFCVRPPTLRLHAGQIAFPGGQRDRGETPEATARRETFEELGVPPDALVLLGALPPRTSSSGIHVHCLVARLAPVPIVPAPHEVERVLRVPFAELRDPARWDVRAPEPNSGARHPASPHFTFGTDVVWGLTGRFVNELVQRLAAL